MTEFYNVCGRSENPKTKKVNWPQIGSIIKKDDGKMYFKLNTNPDQLFHCFLQEPKNIEQQPAPQQSAPAPTEAPVEELDISQIPF